MTDAPDPRPLLAAALDQAGRLVHTVSPADLAKPTPCTEYDVRALVSHLLAVENRIALIIQGAEHAALPREIDRPEDDWAAGWDEHRVALDQALTDDAALGRIVHHPAGDMPGAKALFIYVSEIATHGWDLAAALGRTSELDQAIAAPILAPIKAALPADWRGEEVPFGTVVEVADDSAPYDQLVGWLGRNPSWQPAPV